MSEEYYFAQALSNFTRNFAYGDAICHLVDKGYTTERIIREFHYPLPDDTIDRMVTDHLIDHVYQHFIKNNDDLAYVKEVKDGIVELWLREKEQRVLNEHKSDMRSLRSLAGNKLAVIKVKSDQVMNKAISESGIYLH